MSVDAILPPLQKTYRHRSRGDSDHSDVECARLQDVQFAFDAIRASEWGDQVWSQDDRGISKDLEDRREVTEHQTLLLDEDDAREAPFDKV